MAGKAREREREWEWESWSLFWLKSNYVRPSLPLSFEIKISQMQKVDRRLASNLQVTQEAREPDSRGEQGAKKWSDSYIGREIGHLIFYFFWHLTFDFWLILFCKIGPWECVSWDRIANVALTYLSVPQAYHALTHCAGAWLCTTCSSALIDLLCSTIFVPLSLSHLY